MLKHINKETFNRGIVELLSIKSPTYQEKVIKNFIKKKLTKDISLNYLLEEKDSIICQLPCNGKKNLRRKHVVFVGHLDVVPEYFKPFIKDNKVYGAGASDMKIGLNCFLYLIEYYLKDIQRKYNLSFIFYSREENTPLKENGLYSLIEKYPNFFKTIDLAIIGEPTNNEIQIGCVGSAHAEVTFYGKACHSARSWEGENAFYKALPFIQFFSQLPCTPHKIFSQIFYNVFSITESQSELGKTTIPSWWKCNVNFRFAPIYSEQEAKKYFLFILKKAGACENNIKITSMVPAAKVIESNFFKQSINELKVIVKSKQAWTDVAQFSQLGIPSFNYGPGLTSQCHVKNEYADLKMAYSYVENLLDFLCV